MKKFFDKYVFSRFGVQLSVSVCILLLFALLVGIMYLTANLNKRTEA